MQSHLLGLKIIFRTKTAYSYMRYITCISALSLTGCMQHVSLKQPEYDIGGNQAFLVLREKLLNKNTELNEKMIPQLWFKLFNDPTLMHLEELLIQSNLDLESAVLSIEEAKSLANITNAARKPSLSVDADYVRSAISENTPLAKIGANTSGYNLWSMGVQAKWELDLWGYLKHRTNAATEGVKVKQFNYLDVKVSLSAELARNYLLLRGLQNQHKIIHQQELLNLQLLKIAQNKFEQGVMTKEGIADAKEELLKSNQLAIESLNNIDIQKNIITLLLAQPPRSLESILYNRQTSAKPKKIPIGLAFDFVQQRPDILSAETALRIALENVAAAKADFYPRIGLSAQLGQQAINLSNLGDWGSNQYGVGPTFHLPIFEGGRLKRTLELNETRQKLAAIHYKKTVLNAWHEIDMAFSNYDYQAKSSSIISKMIVEKSITQRVKERNFKAGTIDLSEVLQVKKQLLNLQLENIRSGTAQSLAIVSLYRSLGAGVLNWDKHLNNDGGV